MRYHHKVSFELTTFETNKDRCAAAGKRMCPYYNKQPSEYGYDEAWRPEHVWTDTPCHLRAQIDTEGTITIVHTENTLSHFKENAFGTSGNSFQVTWEGGNRYPTVGAGCGAGCTISGSTCLCNVEVRESAVFGAATGHSTASKIPTRSDIEDRCFLGSASPDMLDAGLTKCTTAACMASRDHEVEVWLKTADLDANTIFKIHVFGGHGPVRYIQNRRSMVILGDGYSFRNPPHFMAFWRPYEQPKFQLAAQHETEALLDHLFYHQNTRAFIGYRLIQRLVTSNPSPRYLEVVSTAFATGTYGGRSYSGQYGDLAATVAAILMDEEARSELLDLDPYHGRLQEPLLKVAGLNSYRSPTHYACFE